MSDLAQTLIYASQTMDIPSHRRAVEQAADEIARLQAEVERLRARVAQLEVAALDAIQAMPGGQAKADLRDAYDEDTPATAWLLRKQAEAVEAAVYELTPGHYGPPDDPSPEFVAACEMCAEFSGYAQRLRQQAAEIEK